MEYYLLIDLGTGSTRTALVDRNGELLAIRSFFNHYYRDDAYPDAQYFLPEEWEKEILRCCRELHAERPEIHVCAVSSAGARQTIVLLDRNGVAFYALPNIDNRGREFMDEIGDHDHIYECSGKWVTEDFCAAKLLGLHRKKPEIYEQIGTVLSLSEWIAYLFTGNAVFEPSQACETQLYDLNTMDWSEELCRVYDINRGLLPSLVAAGKSAGAILPQLRKELGMADDAIFVVGGADTQCALMQTGIEAGDIAVISGTTTPCTALIDYKYHDRQQRVWIDANLGTKGFLIEMNPGVTGLNYQYAKDALCPDISYETLEQIYAEKKDFACTASFSSLLFYERRSLRRGGFFMRSPFPGTLDRSDMMWAVLADVACATYEQLWRLRELSCHQRDYVLGCGGGFRSGTLCQMLADLSGVALRLQPGFQQATLCGLVKICNRAMGLTAGIHPVGESLVYQPQEGDLIRRYLPIWNQNRLFANSIS